MASGSNRTLIFFAAVLFIVGLYTGFSLGFRSSSNRPGATPPVSGHGPVRADEGAVSRPPAANNITVSAHPRAPRTPEAELIQSLISSIQMPVADAARGTGVIRGTVTGEDGRGMPGVRVLANPQRPFSRHPFHAGTRSGTSLNETEALEAEIRRTLEWQFQQRALKRETVTDLAGRYTLSELEAIPHHVTASRDGYILEAQPQNTALVTPDAELNFLARQLVEIVCRVRNPDGTEPDRANIRVTGGATGASSTAYHGWAPDNATLRIRPGSWQMRAEVQDQEIRLSSDPQAVTVTADSDAPLTFELKAPVGVRGTVALPAGIQNASMQVCAIQWSADPPPAAQVLRDRGKSVWVSIPHRKSYAIQDLPPGDYFIGLVTWGSEMIFASGRARVEAEMAEVNLEMTALDSRDIAIVRVYGPDGKPLTDVSIWAGASPMSGRNADGSHWIVHPPRSGTEPCSLTVRSIACGQKTVTYEPAEKTELAVTFDLPARLTVSLAGARPPPNTRLFVSLRDPQAGNRFGGSNSQLKGTEPVLLKNVTAGEYTLAVSCQSDFGMNDIFTRPVTLLAGDNQTVIELPPLYSLTVRVEDKDYGNTLLLKTPDGRRGGHAWLQNSRQATFEGLIAGRYVLEMTGGRKTGSLEVTIPDQLVVTFALAARNALQVTVTQPDGYLARAGLKTGDMVTAFNDSAFKDVFNVDRILDSFAAMEQINAVFYRDGKPFQVTLDGRQLRGNSAGGSFKGIQVQWQ